MELINTETIQHKIHTIREVQIILDKDLAQFYGVKPIRLREQIKRNPNRFPPDFVFPLSETEIEYMRLSKKPIWIKKKSLIQKCRGFLFVP